LLNGDAKVLTLSRTITLPKQPVNSERHDVEVRLTITNHSDQTHRVITVEQGPVGIQRMDKRTDLRAIDIAQGTSEQVNVKRHGLAGVKPSDSLIELEGVGPFWWAALQNQYFAFAYLPREESGNYPTSRVASVEGVDIDGVAETNEDKTFRIVSVGSDIAPGQSLSFATDAYIGPKDKDMFSHVEEYKKLGFERMVTNGYPGCTFDALTNFMIWLLIRLKPVTFGNYGFAIIILVLIVRTVLHPITKKGQVNMMKMSKEMGALAPKVEEAKKKFPNDKAKQSQETMKVYQEAGVNPAGNVMSCLPMLLQMPIWVALYASLNNNIAMRLEPFVLWIRDLTAPDELIQFGTEFTIPLIGGIMGPVKSLNVLPLLWGVTLYFQQKYMPKPTSPAASDKMSEQLAMQQKMMPIMFGFMVVLFYNMPSGMTLYIMASTLFGTIEQIRIRKHIRDMEDNPDLAAKPKKPKTSKGPGIFERMQKMAEEAQRAQSAQQKKRK
jgi:YidC/Oxa1 family membrane protein insertase